MRCHILRALAADRPLLHLQSFYHTRGHYPGHRNLSECSLVSEALGVPRQFEGLAHLTGLAFRFESAVTRFRA